MSEFVFRPIGHIQSPYTEKFGIPRQAGLAPDIPASIKLLSPYNTAEALRGLDGFSHLWLIWIAHNVPLNRTETTVRPPRLGGNERVGVFASRSVFRPNPIGQSLVELKEIQISNHHATLQVSGIDLLDGTPILDIKPYLHWSDSRSDAKCGFANNQPEQKLNIDFSPVALAQCQHIETQTNKMLTKYIQQIFSLDPRPAYHKKNHEDRIYGLSFDHYDIKFQVHKKTLTILEIIDL